MPVESTSLKRVPLFSSLGDKQLKKLVPHFQERRFPAGYIIATEGERGSCFFIIESGTATVTAHGETRATLGPGAHFGEIAALDLGTRVATVTAETGVTAVMLMGWDLRQLIRDDADLAAGIIEGLVQIVRRLEDRLAADTGARAGAHAP